LAGAVGILVTRIANANGLIALRNANATIWGVALNAITGIAELACAIDVEIAGIAFTREFVCIRHADSTVLVGAGGVFTGTSRGQHALPIDVFVAFVALANRGSIEDTANGAISLSAGVWRA